MREAKEELKVSLGPCQFNLKANCVCKEITETLELERCVSSNIELWLSSINEIQLAPRGARQRDVQESARLGGNTVSLRT